MSIINSHCNHHPQGQHQPKTVSQKMNSNEVLASVTSALQADSYLYRHTKLPWQCRIWYNRDQIFKCISNRGDKYDIDG